VDDKATIYANNFRVKQSDLEDITQLEAIAKAGAVATDAAGETAVVNVVADGKWEALKDGEAGVTYPLTFGNASKPSLAVTVDVEVYADGDNGEGADAPASLYANNFNIELADLGALDWAGAVSRAGAAS
jgi:hypothetical protein